MVALERVDTSRAFSFKGALFIYGVGDFALSSLLRRFLEKEDNYLIFIEEKEELFLLAKQALAFHHPKIRVYFHGEESDLLYHQIALEFLLLPFGFALSSKEDRATPVFSLIDAFHAKAELLAQDSQDMGGKVLGQIYRNQKMLPCSLMGSSLENQFQGIPAIVVGAGASLDQQIPYLKALGDRALLIAGGSAVSALCRHQIRPHFCVHLDPDPPRARFLSQDVYEAAHLYKSRFSSELLPTIHAPLFWMAASGSYPIESWIQEQYGAAASFHEGGWTVANFAVAWSYFLGCDPIMTLGMEFSCERGSVYAGGLSSEEHREWIILSSGRVSKADWLMSAQWLQDFVKTHPDRRMINATEGGLEIEGMEKKKMEEIPSLLSTPYDLLGLLHARTKGAVPFPAQREDVERVCLKLQHTRDQSERLCVEMLSLWEKSYPASPMETHEYVLRQMELEQEPFYQQHLLPFWNLWKGSILRQNTDPLGKHLHALLFFIRVMEASCIK